MIQASVSRTRRSLTGAVGAIVQFPNNNNINNRNHVSSFHHNGGGAVGLINNIRLFSSNNNNNHNHNNNNNDNKNRNNKNTKHNNATNNNPLNKSTFRPNRQPNPNYHASIKENTTFQKPKVRRKDIIPSTLLQPRMLNDNDQQSSFNNNKNNRPLIDSNNKSTSTSLENDFGPLTADVIRQIQRRHQRMAIYRPTNSRDQTDNDDNDSLSKSKKKYNNMNVIDNNEDIIGLYDDAEEDLGMLDYYLSDPGSTEDLVGERRGLAIDIPNKADRIKFLKDIDDIIDKERIVELGLEEYQDQSGGSKKKAMKDINQDLMNMLSSNDGDESNSNNNNIHEEDRDPDIYFDKNQLIHGDWSEMLITVDRNVKLWRGGRLESYRALVIGGNLNGCGGFGIGKSIDPMQAVEIASRKCKNNIFFVERYNNNGITHDIVGKQNSCKLIIRSIDSDHNLRGNPLVREILKRFGITSAISKAYGNRSPFNVVRATFKALMTHESIEDISLKRGKRIVNIERARRLQV